MADSVIIIEVLDKIYNLLIKMEERLDNIETHLKNIDESLAKLLKKAGVKLMYVGIESSDENVRKNSNRISENNFSQEKKISYLESIGIKVKAMYIVGMPTDTIETFKKTIEFAKKIKSSYAQFSVFTPYPGTPIFKEYQEKIITKKYENFTQWQLIFEHPNFKPDDISNLLNYSYKQYYFNINWIFTFLVNKIKGIYEDLYIRIFGFSR